MNRSRIALSALALILAATASACGSDSDSDSAPTTASQEDFCEGQGSLLKDLAGAATKLPEPEELAKTLHDWADKVEEIGTPKDMSDEVRAGFEETIEQARDIEASDLEADKLDELGEELEGDAEDRAQAFNDYVGEKCGNLLNDLEDSDLGSGTDSPETDSLETDSIEPSE